MIMMIQKEMLSSVETYMDPAHDDIEEHIDMAAGSDAPDADDEGALLCRTMIPLLKPPCW